MKYANLPSTRPANKTFWRPKAYGLIAIVDGALWPSCPACPEANSFHQDHVHLAQQNFEGTKPRRRTAEASP